ncbi:MAG TPA: beta-ketoacyl synthase N-terminal-like domain-containing protein, partial [Roseiflexaceae bacterium]
MSLKTDPVTLFADSKTMRTNPTHRVVVTGMGAITPLGNSVPAFWEGLTAGHPG